jgi:hypothetical protein
MMGRVKEFLYWRPECGGGGEGEKQKKGELKKRYFEMELNFWGRSYKNVLIRNFTFARIKLECLILTNISTLVKTFRVRLEPTRVEHQWLERFRLVRKPEAN